MADYANKYFATVGPSLAYALPTTNVEDYEDFFNYLSCQYDDMPTLEFFDRLLNDNLTELKILVKKETPVKPPTSLTLKTVYLKIVCFPPIVFCL